MGNERDQETQECGFEEFADLLRREGQGHSSLYHYTRWDAFAKMMTPVQAGACEGKRVMLLSPAPRMNDKIEQGWGRNVFMSCFSYSKYEDVAMWMNYGKRSPDAIRVKLNGEAVADWYREHCKRKDGVYFLTEQANLKDGGWDVNRLEPLDPARIESIELADVAYVIAGKLLTKKHWGNVEHSRRFYHVARPDGGCAWSDAIYDGRFKEVAHQMPALFKKRGWGYERETRLVITLREDANPMPERLAVDFGTAFGALVDAVQTGPSAMRDGDRARPKQMLMRGPWYDEQCATSEPAGALQVRDVKVDSDYASEIKIISSVRKDVRELAAAAEKGLEEFGGRQRRHELTKDDRQFLREFGYDLINAAKTINHHVDRADYKPNKYRLARLEILDARRLAELSFADKRAGEYLDALRQIAMSSKNGWKDRIVPNVKEYDK